MQDRQSRHNPSDSKKDIQPKKKPPTQEQIAILHGLLQETADLAKQINYPLNSLFFGTLCTIMFNFITREQLNTIVESFTSNVLHIDQEASSVLASGLTLATTMPVTYYLYYKFWQFLLSRSLEIFPNGVGFTRTSSYTLKDLQQEFRSQTEVARLINELKNLITQQTVAKNRGIYFSIAASTIIPMCMAISNFSETDEVVMRFNVGMFGPGMEICTLDANRNEKLTNFGFFLKKSTEAVQRLPILRRAYDYWSNYNTPKQLDNYVKSLERFNFSDYKWQIVENTKASKVTAIFSLKIPSNKDVNFKDNNLQSQKISEGAFFIELHRTLLTEGVTVFACDNHTLYVGYHNFNESTIRNIQYKLKANLLRSALYEKCAQTTIEKLNEISVAAKIKDRGWDSYRKQNHNGEIEAYYYISVHQIPRVVVNHYIAALSSFAPAKNINLDGEILTLSQVSSEFEKFETVKNTLEKNIRDLQTPTSTSLSLQNFSATTQAASKGKSTKQLSANENKHDSKSEAPVKTSASSPYPESIDFSNNVRFIKDEKIHSVERAYPMHVPWLQEGQAYGSIDGRVISQVSNYLKEKEIFSRLEKGVITKSDKTKSGGVGIQPTDEAYKNVDGEKIPCAAFKLKFFNNIRIWGRNMNEKSPYVHYRFDGWGPGH